MSKTKKMALIIGGGALLLFAGLCVIAEVGTDRLLKQLTDSFNNDGRGTY